MLDISIFTAALEGEGFRCYYSASHPTQDLTELHIDRLNPEERLFTRTDLSGKSVADSLRFPSPKAEKSLELGDELRLTVKAGGDEASQILTIGSNEQFLPGILKP